jgi:putative membrane-bound dehydrogenase-like protein
MIRTIGLVTFAYLFFIPSIRAADPPLRAGVASIDLTPDYPVRLAGFGNRRDESVGVTQPIHAKALAIDDGGAPFVLVVADLCGVPASVAEELAKRLKPAGVQRERLALAVTHTHTGPMVTGYLRTLFGTPIPPDHQAHIDRFSTELLDKLEKVAKAALADRRPARLAWGVGTGKLAKNRRAAKGPSDHDLPVLTVRDPDGKLRAVWASYACHCVTLSNNKISGDWAGFAQEAIETEFPGAVALISVGCGADQNPISGVTGDKVDVATAQGREFAAEVKRVVNSSLTPITGPIAARMEHLELPLAALPPRATWEDKAKNADPKQAAVAYHAKAQLARLDRGEPLAMKVEYSPQAWTFGDGLAMVFLPGEVVVDYSLRLKKELDGRRIWINAYSNDVPCYIPSERVLKEGGYEGAYAMTYYDLPGPFKPGLEQQIIDAVHKVVGEKFRSPLDLKKTNSQRPLSPQQSIATIHTRPGMTTELMAAEPLVTSPVAIAFGPDGRLWVAEMYDYPAGPDGKFKPAGRVRVLSSSHGDGHYDQSTVFLDNIPFPTGVTVWRNGVLVCAAPDILYAEDTKGTGKADVVKKLFSGFGTENYQARVNSLEYGLDGWVYGSCGLFGGNITSFSGKTLGLGNRDFRIKPDTGEIEPASGRTQQGRVRDDWDNWFGCDNTHLGWHYPLPDHYVRRNPHAAPPNPAVLLVGDASKQLFPAGNLQLFKLSGPPGRPTAVCGLGVYRDDLLGKDVTGDLFSCEPVNLLVHRMKLVPKGSTFTAKRPPGEEKSEFLTSTDSWFRPVQVRTGPDGCLWVVDMHRFVIEHPRWIPPEELAQVDVRAGATLGRIIRIRPTDREPRPMMRLDKLDNAGLVAALDSPNGCQRDLAMQMLLWRDAKDAAPALAKLAAECPRPEGRLQALCALDGLGKNDVATVGQALADSDVGVRRNAVRVAGEAVSHLPEVGPLIVPLVRDDDVRVRLEVAFALGNWDSQLVGPALVRLAAKAGDRFYTYGICNSINPNNLTAVLDAIGAGQMERPAWDLIRGVVPLGIATDQQVRIGSMLRSLARATGDTSNQMMVFHLAFEALDRRGQTLEQWAGADTAEAIRPTIAQARDLARQQRLADDTPRILALSLLNRDATQRAADLAVLQSLLGPRNSSQMQIAAATALVRNPPDSTGEYLFGVWAGYSPQVKSGIIDLILSRPGGTTLLLDAIERNAVPAAQISAAHRQRLASVKDTAIRDRATKLLAAAINPDRQKVLDAYQDALKMAGDSAHGQAVFAKSCSVCHQLEKVGHVVGPDLAQLQNKSPAFLLQEIIDPNRNVDSRYVEYRATTKAGRVFNGLLFAESATSITLRAQEGRDQPLLREEIDELESTGRSLMPEGLEKDLSRQDLADLIAFLGNPKSEPPPATADLAKQILDDTKPPMERQALIAKESGKAGELVAALVADMPANAKEEYRRIPWVWRVALAAGKRNDAAELKRLLEVTLPKAGEPLHNWQAVVIGGGVINGLSQQNVWPKHRLDEVMGPDAELLRRWQAARDLAATMADNAKVPPGTRYDALRMIALGSWEKRGPQLVKYLARDANAELQMGAVSGLSDMDAAGVAQPLIAALPGLAARNRGLALDALVRTEPRTAALLDAVERGQVAVDIVDDAHRQTLRAVSNPTLRARAVKAFPP